MTTDYTARPAGATKNSCQLSALISDSGFRIPEGHILKLFIKLLYPQSGIALAPCNSKATAELEEYQYPKLWF
jgi:hypothetical protein